MAAPPPEIRSIEEEDVPLAGLGAAISTTVLWRLENAPGTALSDAFTDVASGIWYTEAVAWAANNGIVNGYAGGTFQPERNITRQEMAAILYRYMDHLGYDVTGRAALDSFSDGGETGAWALDYLRWANSAGIITGKNGGRIDPLGNASRAEVATMLQRVVSTMLK